jgi:isopentenyl diphosphate isomerase/L-lactate dehydrogenase-like FMN-dependent dehydrogenase
MLAFARLGSMSADAPVVEKTPMAQPSPKAFPQLVCVDDFRTMARRRLPRAIFDFIDGAAGHEQTMRANEDAFRRYAFRPRLLTDVSRLDPSTTVLGRRVDVPILLGPAGMHRLVCREGELAAAKVAKRMGTAFVLSIGSSRTLEDVAAAAPGADLWLQVYLWNTREWVEQVIRRAEVAGYRALCVTVDSKAPGGRKYRDLRNGLLDPRISVRSALDAARHPRWVADFLLGPRIVGAHLLDDGGSQVKVSLFRAPAVIQRRMDPSATWDEIAWLRRVWPGPLVVKGVLTAEDARRAFERGADAVICSNHGGRVLDGDPPTLYALPRVVEAAARAGKEVLVDGGIRTGGDVAKALALGARACLVARPYWWGLAVGGEEGAAQVIDMLKRELESTMTQLGRPRVEELDQSAVELLPFSLPPARAG